MPKCLCVAFALLLACDGSSTKKPFSESCPVFSPCGGNLVGSWTIKSMCTDFSKDTSLSCEGLTVSSSLQPSGTLTFASDGSYVSQGSVSGSMSTTYPASCMTNLGVSCSSLNSANNPAKGFSISCGDSTTGDCVCNETLVNKPTSEQGTYAVSGPALSLVVNGKAQDPSQYCVAGDTLTLQSLASSGATATLVGTRQ